MRFFKDSTDVKPARGLSIDAAIPKQSIVGYFCNYVPMY